MGKKHASQYANFGWLLKIGCFLYHKVTKLKANHNHLDDLLN